MANQANNGSLTIFHLLWPTLFVGGGGEAGKQVGLLLSSSWSMHGAIVGMLAGLALLVGLSYLLARESSQHPSCQCGAGRQEDFDYELDDRWGILRRCCCGLLYMMRGGNSWYRFLPNGTTTLWMKRDFYGRWQIAEGPGARELHWRDRPQARP